MHGDAEKGNRSRSGLFIVGWLGICKACSEVAAGCSICRGNLRTLVIRLIPPRALAHSWHGALHPSLRRARRPASFTLLIRSPPPSPPLLSPLFSFPPLLSSPLPSPPPPYPLILKCSGARSMKHCDAFVCTCGAMSHSGDVQTSAQAHGVWKGTWSPRPGFS